MTYYQNENVALRSENVDAVIKNIAAANFVMKQAVSVVNSSAWEETYYRESIKSLAAKQGIPRLAAFPMDSVEWEKNTSRMQKFGLETEISWEDAMTNRVDVIGRSLYRIGHRIGQMVDTHIWNTITENVTPVNINTVATYDTWSATGRASRLPHEDIARACASITNSNLQSYKPDTLLLSPTDYIYVVTNDYVLDSFDASSPEVMKTGDMGTLLGLKVLVSPAVTADKAAVCQSKIVGTYRVAEALKTAVNKQEGKAYDIRAWEIGVCQLTDPKAMCLITNTQ